MGLVGMKAGIQSLPGGVFVRTVLQDKGAPAAEWPLRTGALLLRIISVSDYTQVPGVV